MAISQLGSATEFRTSGGMMLPYIDLDLRSSAEMPVTRILVGPGPIRIGWKSRPHLPWRT